MQGALADALKAVANKGPNTFYEDELGRELADAVEEDGGLMSLDDLRAYAPAIRAPVSTQAFGWRIESTSAGT